MNPQGILNQFSIPPMESEPHLLITSVRKQYFEYLFKLLKQNYIEWCGEFPPGAVLGATKELELEAAAQAMVVPLYRQSIGLMMKSIKQHTQNKDLFPKFGEYCIKRTFSDKSSQTDEEMITDRNDEIHTNSNSNVVKTQNGTFPAANLIQDDNKDDDITDQVLKDMEEMFKTDESELNECDIFGDVENKMQIKLIMQEIQMFDNNKTKDCSIPSPNNCNNNVIEMQEDVKMYVKSEERIQTNSAFAESIATHIQSKSEIPNRNGYVYSRWPCELYYQKKILREKLDNLCDKSFRLHSRVKSRYIEVFGAESEDEQGLQSPDSSQDFIRSCRQRITQWVSRHMKPYYSRGNIPSHLFRPLFKYLIYKLIQINQYPSDYEVYLFIKEYFKHHSRIKCQADF